MRKMAASFASYAPERSGNQAPARFKPKDRADSVEAANTLEHNGACGVAAAWIAMYLLVIAVGLLRAIAVS